MWWDDRSEWSRLWSLVTLKSLSTEVFSDRARIDLREKYEALPICEKCCGDKWSRRTHALAGEYERLIQLYTTLGRGWPDGGS